jgi:3-methyladenine DNA glycosylase Mpg
MKGQDRYNFNLAAQHLGMSRAVLMRVLLVKGAERILRELGVEVEYEQDTHIDLSKGETLIEKAGD